MAKRYHKNKAKQIAKNHMDNLEDQIDKQRFVDASLAQKYLEMIRRLSRKFKIPVSRTIKRQYCKQCHILLTPGLNARVRLRDGKRVLYCYSCKNFTRTPYSKKKEN
ncbi:hypothetical protein JXA48_00675 [Candidatus Woesearchaeota archaeon]|nr:hypothetical protein [Candidatus Woesearchaeota archaeon]